MILYRAVSLQEMELIYDSGMQAFPASLPQQPIFYPVLQLEYARQIASGWNVKNGQFAGYVTEFKVEAEYLSQFEEHTVGESQHEELWIPAEEMDEFNRHIVGHIKVLEAYFGDAFEGFIPEGFGLQNKKAVDQFTLLADSYLYKRMDFYLEIKRNHKAVFLNYPFWQKYDFKNPRLKEKIIQAIKEAWLASFPKVPLPLPPPIPEESPLEKQSDSPAPVDSVQEDRSPSGHSDSGSLANPVHDEVMPGRQPESYSLRKSLQEEITPLKRRDLHSLMDSVHENTSPVQETDSHFVQGVKAGLSGNYGKAIEELFKAVEEDPDHVVARTSLGVAFHRLGEDDRALACYQTVSEIDPQSAEAHYFCANIFYSRGNIREAIAEYTLAIGLEPELIDAHEGSAPQDRLTDYTRAPVEMSWIARSAHRILELNKSLETNPRQTHLLKERAAEHSRLWNYEKAIADYSASLAIQPEDASALHFRGVAYEQLGQPDRALEDYQQAIAIQPDISVVYINRGITFGQMGNFRQSIASLTEGIRLAPQSPDGYFNRGVSYFQFGDIASAIDDFSRVIDLSPNDEAAYYWRGIAYEEAGRQGEAIADYERFLALSQNPQTRKEIEQKLRRWNARKQDRPGRSGDPPNQRQSRSETQPEKPVQKLDVYDLIVALGNRARDSLWLGSGVDCRGETAQELFSYADQNLAINGSDFLRITSGMHDTSQGDFTAFDPGASAHWIFIRAWGGSGFYIELNDPQAEQRLRTHLESVEEVEGADPPYTGLFIRT